MTLTRAGLFCGMALALVASSPPARSSGAQADVVPSGAAGAVEVTSSGLWGDVHPAPTPVEDAAFMAVYQAPEPTRVVVRPSSIRCCGYSGLGDRRVTLAVKPAALLALGGDRYALVSLETDEMGAHSDPGAISIAYLTMHNGRWWDWRVDHVWNELAWTGDNGDPADELVAPRAGAATPVLFAVREAVHQGVFDTTAWAIALDPAAPRALARIPFGGRLTEVDSGSQLTATCGAWRYRASLDVTAPAQITVTYQGWRRPPGARTTINFVKQARYETANGRLIPVVTPKLPVCGGLGVGG